MVKPTIIDDARNLYRINKLESVMAAAVGKVFYVNGITGDDGDSGDQDGPFQTITNALAECVNDRNDYIMVIDCWDADAGAITVNKSRVHIIAIGNPLHGYCGLKATGDTNIFKVTGYYSEIAGFCLGGGTTHAGVEISAYGLWLHHNTFGYDDIGDTPGYGVVFTPGAVNPYELIEDNLFLGTGKSSEGTITANGIQSLGYNRLRSSVFRNNLFVQIPGIAINMEHAFGLTCVSNLFALPSDTAGKAITLGGGSGCLFDDNRANYGKTTMSANPYVDGTGDNCWLVNWKGYAVVQPG